MNKKIIIIVLIFLLVSLISAQDLKIELQPHYYTHTNISNRTNNTGFDGIVIEIIGENLNENSRILNIEIVDASPLAFKNSLNSTTQSLRILQEKTLWSSNLIDVDNFIEGNITFWINVSGTNEKTKEKLYAENSTVLFIKKLKQQKDPLIVRIGDTIWEDNYLGGLLVLSGAIFMFCFIFWKRNVSDKLEEWREKSEQKRIERKKLEEGW